MNFTIFVAGIMLLFCALSSKILYKYGIPTLVAFLILGMLMGSEGIGGIYFDDAKLAESICNIGLIFIMFSGGFGTNWKTARPVIATSGVLATAGVAITALLVGIFAYFVLGFSFLEGMLLGSIVSSTDAASVFSILRSKKLNLKNNIAPMLELESGSNDPMSYMLTAIFLSLLQGQRQNIAFLIVREISVGVLAGLLVGMLAVYTINKINLDIDGLYTIIAAGFVLLSFAGASLLGGNGFLAVYLTGIWMGNKRLVHKISLVRYFDGISWLMQILLFFTLGLLVFPSRLAGVAIWGIITAAFIIFIARPAAIFLILSAFKRPWQDKLFISWVGLRGAASIVFATYPLTEGLPIADAIFNTVFFIALVSVLLQGTLFVPFAKKLNLIGPDETVLKTFTDYSGELHTEMLEIVISDLSQMAEKRIMDLDIPKDILIVMIHRDGRLITPRGPTILKAGDKVMMSADRKSRLILMDEWAKSAEIVRIEE